MSVYQLDSNDYTPVIVYSKTIDFDIEKVKQTHGGITLFFKDTLEL